MSDATGPDCSEVSNAKTDICVDSTGTMDDDRPEGAEGIIDIVTKEKQTDAKSGIYYAMHLSKNKTPTTPDKTKKPSILINSLPNIQLFIKAYNVERENE